MLSFLHNEFCRFIKGLVFDLLTPHQVIVCFQNCWFTVLFNENGSSKLVNCCLRSCSRHSFHVSPSHAWVRNLCDHFHQHGYWFLARAFLYMARDPGQPWVLKMRRTSHLNLLDLWLRVELDPGLLWTMFVYDTICTHNTWNYQHPHGFDENAPALLVNDQHKQPCTDRVTNSQII